MAQVLCQYINGQTGSVTLPQQSVQELVPNCICQTDTEENWTFMQVLLTLWEEEATATELIQNQEMWFHMYSAAEELQTELIKK